MCVCVCVVVVVVVMSAMLQLMWSSVGAGVHGCRLIHQYSRCVLVIPVLGSELSSGGMVGVTQYHCYMKLHYVL